MLGEKYIVKDNDSLSSISQTFFNTPDKWQDIFTHNNSQAVKAASGDGIANEDVIYIGQVLYIPKAATKVASTPKPRYMHFRSKAKQWDKYKDSIFLKGVAQPVMKVDVNKLAELKSMAGQTKEYALRIKLARAITNDAMDPVIKGIRAIPELKGIGLVYMDSDFTMVRIMPTLRTDNAYVLIREINKTDSFAMASSLSANKRVIQQLVLAGLSCGGAALGYVSLTAEGLAIPVTGGSSALLMGVTYGATVASTASCGVYAGRVINEVSGNSAYNDYLDKNNAYFLIMVGLDAISLAGAAGSVKSASSLLRRLTSKNLSRNSMKQILTGLSRADRKRLLKEMIKINNPSLSNKELKGLLRSMDAPKIFSQSQVRSAMKSELQGAVGSVFGLIASSKDGIIGGVADGSLKTRIIAIIADEQT